MNGLEVFCIFVTGLVVIGAVMALFQEQGRWLLFQGLIVFLVVASNIQWHWSPNANAPVLFGFILAFGATTLYFRIRYGEWLWPAD